MITHQSLELAVLPLCSQRLAAYSPSGIVTIHTEGHGSMVCIETNDPQDTGFVAGLIAHARAQHMIAAHKERLMAKRAHRKT